MSEMKGRPANGTIEDVAAVLREAGSVLIFPHISADGDAMGSSVALCAAMRKLGKVAHIVTEDELSESVAFLDDGLCTRDLGILPEPDVCVCVDCGDEARFPDRRELFRAGRTRVCIDHHETSVPFVETNHIDVRAAATAEIVYDLLNRLGVGPDRRIDEAIYTGIVTDTGGFRYSNTTQKTHLIAAELFARGIDHGRIAMLLYQNVSRERKMLETRILATTEIFADGRGASAVMTLDMLGETGASDEDTESVVESLRSLRGVEVACFLKEKPNGLVKASLRSKRFLDVGAFSEKRGGGGHPRAAGFTAAGVIDRLRADITAALESEATKEPL